MDLPAAGVCEDPQRMQESTDLEAPARAMGRADAGSGDPAAGAPSSDPRPGRSLLVPAAIGAAAVWVLFVVILTYGRGDPLHPETFGNFYDAQARALMDGHMDVDPAAVGFEGFVVGGRTFIYQGIVPALARIPFLAVADGAYGRLTALSMAAGMAVAVAHVALAVVVARRLVRGDAPVGRAERWWVALTVAGLGATPMLFLSAKAWVYHEALLWGGAFTMLSLAHLLRWLERSRRGDDRLGPLVVAGAGAVLALNTRLPTGIGALAALGLVGAVLLAAVALDGREGWSQRIERWTGWRRSPRERGALVVLVLTAVVGLGSYAAVNTARFGSAFGLPIAAQGVASSDEEFRTAIEDNDGSLFGLRYTPSVLLQLVRPDAVGVRDTFPWLGFPSWRPTTVGDVRFAERDWSTSLPISTPLGCVLGVVGVVALVRPRRWSVDGDVVVARPVVLGGAASLAGIGVLGYIANRYQVDVLPAVVVAAAVGGAAAGGRASSPTARRVLVGLTAVGAVWGAWLNSAVALQYQREVAAGAWDGARAGWVGLQSTLGPAPDVRRVVLTDPLPEPGPLGEVVVVGDCRAVYRSDSEIWMLLEGDATAGSYELELTGREPVTDEVTVLEGVGSGGSNRLIVEPDGRPGLVHLQVEVSDGGETRRGFPGPPFRLDPGDRIRLRTQLDWRTGSVEIRDAADRRLLGALVDMVPTGAVRPVREAGGPVEVSGDPRRAEVCRSHLR